MDQESKEVFKVAVYGIDDASQILQMLHAVGANVKLFRINDPSVLGEINEDDFDLVIVNDRVNEISNIVSNPDMFISMNLEENYSNEESVKQDGKKIIASLYAAKQKRYKKEIKVLINKLEDKVMSSNLSDDEKIAKILNEYLKIMYQKCKTTYFHIINVCKYIDLFIDGLPESHKPTEEQRIFLKREALLHDVGKLSVLTEILTKTGKLTDEEYEAIKDHVSTDSFLFESDLMQQFKSAALFHHLRYDGGKKSYPKEYSFLVGEDIPYFSRIISVVDAFEAMTGNRQYKQHRTLEEVIEILESEKGKQFDPAITDIFIKGIRMHPELDSTLYTTKKSALKF